MFAVCCIVLQCVKVCCSGYFSAPLFSMCQILIELCYTLQHTATHQNTPEHTATHCNTLFGAALFNIPDLDRIVQHTTTHCNTLQHTATHCPAPLFSISQILIELCITLQYTATHCNTLRHIATHCNTLQHTFRRCCFQYPRS